MHDTGLDHLSLVAPGSPYIVDLVQCTERRFAGKPAASGCTVHGMLPARYRLRGRYHALMPIVVFWIETAGSPAHREFGDAELAQALQLTEQLRAQGKRHVTISSELGSSVGKPGVDAVSGGRLPGGEAYEFNKRHRGGGPSG